MGSTSPVFGNMFVAGSLEQAYINTLIKWFPDYVNEVAAQNDLDPAEIAIPKNYTNRNSFDMLPAEELPKVIVISPGTVGDPTMYNNGTYEAAWRIGVGVVHAHKDENTANYLSKVYAAVVREIINDKQTLDDSVYGIQHTLWVNEMYDDVPIGSPTVKTRAASLNFSTLLTGVSTKGRGPLEPDHAPYDYVTVDKVVIQIIKEPVNG